MRKIKGTGHEILDRIASIDKKFIEGMDPSLVPTDPQIFLDWWWDIQAKACSECILSTTRTKVVKPDGLASADIMIVGEGPGALENSTGIPMVGPLELRSSHCSGCSNVQECYSHKLLKFTTSFGKKNKVINCTPSYTGKTELKGTFYLRSAGAILDGILIHKWKMNYPRQNWIDLYNSLHPEAPWTHKSPWFITNIALCRTTDVTKLKDETPSTVTRNKCRKHLAMQYAAVNPKLIIAVGRAALGVLMNSLKGAKSIKPNTFVETKFGPVLFINHPAYYMREDNKETKALGFAKFAKTLEMALIYCDYPV